MGWGGQHPPVKDGGGGGFVCLTEETVSFKTKQ